LHGFSRSAEQILPNCIVAEIPKLSVVMPAYNEMATIEEILSRVQAIDIDKEIVVIDDGSPSK